MKTYNVSKLKTYISKALEEVRSGEEILITDHNRPVARLVSASPVSSLASLPRADFRAFLKIPPIKLKKPSKGGSPKSAAELVREIRDEG